MAQVAEAHIDTCKFLQTILEYYIFIPNNHLQLLEQISDHIQIINSVTTSLRLT